MQAPAATSPFIDVGGSPQRLELTDALYVESIRHTIIIHTLSGKLSVTGTLKSFEERLATHEWRQREHDAEYGEA